MNPRPVDDLLAELDVLIKSPFQWEPIGDSVVVAAGFKARAVIKLCGANWFAVGLPKDGPAIPLPTGGHLHEAIAAADAFMQANETSKAAHKSHPWHTAPPSERQIKVLAEAGVPVDGLNRYGAAARITWARSEPLVNEVLPSS
jgi:hypothetical protein